MRPLRPLLVVVSPVVMTVVMLATLLGAAPATIATTGLGQPEVRPLIADVVARLQIHYATLRDFSADFEHSYAGGVLQASETEFGTVYVKKPGRWRFDYTDPEEKQFISDGATIHSYFPADRQVIVSPVPPGSGASTPARFLAGTGDLASEFIVELLDVNATDPTSEDWRLRLTPVQPNADYEYLTLTVETDSLAIRQLATTDFQGGVSTYTFRNLKENQGLSDTFFAFDPPRGVEVLTDDSFIR